LSPYFRSAQLAGVQTCGNLFLQRAPVSGGLRHATQRTAAARLVGHQRSSSDAKTAAGKARYSRRKKYPAAGATHQPGASDKSFSTAERPDFHLDFVEPLDGGTKA
jgi:hypothetical protein